MEETVLKFTTKDVTIELQGSEEFVERQIRFFKHYLATGESAPKEAAPSAPGKPTLATFFEQRASRSGRGAIQEALLLFGCYLQDVEGQPEFSIEQIGGCFGVVGRSLPKNLHHAVGTLKRKHKWFEEGSKRGYYRLSEKGRKLVRPAPK
ncbi:MAG TPA: hypothetical protein VFY93_10810 [Planctomycetota bacterium]|nr:hypothetical protein [Planctomycetota bacterium]